MTVALVGVAALLAALSLSLQGCGSPAADGASSAPVPVQPAPPAAGDALPAASSRASTSTVGYGEEVAIALAAWDYAGGARLAVRAAPAVGNGSALPSSWLLFDTGSSTVAFCDQDHRLAKKVVSLRTPFLACEQYNPGGDATGFWGYFYEGLLVLPSSVVLASSNYAIMEQQVGMPCSGRLGGIFGAAFAQLDAAYRASDAPRWTPGRGDSCPAEAIGSFDPPLLQALARSSFPALFGIFWSGQLGEGQGGLYLEENAVRNKHYVSGSQAGTASLNELGWMGISVLEIAVDDHSLGTVQCKPAAGAPCILDTGTTALVLPEEMYNTVSQHSGSRLKFTLEGAEGGHPVDLVFDLDSLYSRGWLAPSSAPGLILGMPLWASYYTLFELGRKTVSFVSTAGTAKGGQRPSWGPLAFKSHATGSTSADGPLAVAPADGTNASAAGGGHRRLRAPPVWG